jgi:type I restriction enzyme S subunit
LSAASLARLNTPDPTSFQDDARFALATLQALTKRPDQIKQLRQTILNLAVVGKLSGDRPSTTDALLELRAVESKMRKLALRKPKKFRRSRPKSIGANCPKVGYGLVGIKSATGLHTGLPAPCHT